MTQTAWVMMLASWAVILFFTTRFFVKVLRTPPHPEDGESSGYESTDQDQDHP
jgi:hypothetical protein